MKLLLYCTKAKPYLYKTEDTTYPAYPIGYHTDKDLKVKLSNTNELAYLNGKIVAECDFEVERINYYYLGNSFDDFNGMQLHTNTLKESGLIQFSKLNYYALRKYLLRTEDDYISPSEVGYAIHIKNLHIFDKPRELYDYGMDFPISPICKAPQNMMYANGIGVDKQGRYILISIKPEWLCKILNGEKTIEVRKKVLREML